MKEINLVAFSGGKDSVAMVLHLLRSGVNPETIHLHHHDVDGGGLNLWDWQCTKSYCQAFADYFGLQIFFSGRVGGIPHEKAFETVYASDEKQNGIIDEVYINILRSYQGTREFEDLVKTYFAMISHKNHISWAESIQK